MANDKGEADIMEKNYKPENRKCGNGVVVVWRQKKESEKEQGR